MRMIRNLFLSIIFIVLLITIYMYRMTIYDFFKSLMGKENNIILIEPNEYMRKYDYERFTREEDYIPYSKTDIENIFFNILNNGWNEFVFYCPNEYEECSNDVEEISSDTTLMSNIAGYVSPYNSFSIVNTTVSTNGEIYVHISKKYSDAEITEINSKINSIYTELELEGKTNDEKLKLFHNYLIKNTLYDESFADTKTSIYNATKANGALIDGYAVCSGYADAIAIFLDILNIPNISISSEAHGWNLVYIDDEWLHLDATWNDTEYEYQFYLLTTNKLLELDTQQHTFSRFFIEAF